MNNKFEFIKTGVLNVNGIIHGFSTRKGGVSQPPFDGANMHFRKGDNPPAVNKNRELFFSALGLDGENLCLVEQSHGGEVRLADGLSPSKTEILKVDGLVTCEKGKVLGIYTADCLPILMCDENAEGVAALHAGWRGIIAGLVENGASLLSEVTSSSMSDIKVAIGPGIGSCCFEVGQEVVDLFNTRGLSKFVVENHQSKSYIDLQGSVTHILEKIGIKRNNIEIVSYCTKCEKDMFFSYRRDGWPTGQMLGVVGIL